MVAKLHERGGFNYKGERHFFNGRWLWTWYFRPAGCELFVQYYLLGGVKVRKADVEAFIDQEERATQYYEETLAKQGDVAAATDALAVAKAQYERTRLPDYDPGGSANNPGKVSRIIEANFRLVPDAEAKLERAQKIAAVLAVGNKRWP